VPGERTIFLGRAVVLEKYVPPSTLQSELDKLGFMISNIQNAPPQIVASEQYQSLVDRALDLQKAIEMHGPDYSFAKYIGLNGGQTTRP